MSDSDTDSDNIFVRYEEEEEAFAAVSQQQSRISRGLGSEVKESIGEYVDEFQAVLSNLQGVVEANDTEKCLVLHWNAFNSELLRIMGEKICIALDDTTGALYKRLKRRDLEQKTEDVQDQIRKIEKELLLFAAHKERKRLKIPNYRPPRNRRMSRIPNSRPPRNRRMLGIPDSRSPRMSRTFRVSSDTSRGCHDSRAICGSSDMSIVQVFC
ncbi:hypothetical protein BZA05DRAFT_405299 [Tricharina praecox]|uniref:uncharacterized protein n=1 Tax=Tricharina praecox TaxID=43433 RepID=UPI00221EE4CC|nr:uncharacterized protein BZA05DRAFT_405299 [Tricharina praecox]KAI5847582.1 hypothetical protein BZA05DRAFT_405299 [Tricharina praecox]